MRPQWSMPIILEPLGEELDSNGAHADQLELKNEEKAILGLILIYHVKSLLKLVISGLFSCVNLKTNLYYLSHLEFFPYNHNQ